MSPSFFSHLTIFPSFMVGESAGSWTSVAIVSQPSSRYMTFFTAATIRSADTSVAFSRLAA